MTHRPTFKLALAGIGLALFGTVAGTSGAVAADLITSRDIQDGTIKSRDIDESTVESFRTLRHYTVTTQDVAVEPDSDGTVVASCPRGGDRALGVSGFYSDADPVTVTVLSDGTGGFVSGHNTGAADTLTIRITCAKVFPLL